MTVEHYTARHSR